MIPKEIKYNLHYDDVRGLTMNLKTSGSKNIERVWLTNDKIYVILMKILMNIRQYGLI